jgi:two-component system, chemotaxis family, chemotaxis protein CheY
MPEMDGLEFLRSIRSDPQLKSTGFILLTGRADVELVKRAAQFGANNYLVKPFTVAVLKQKLEQIFGSLT